MFDDPYWDEVRRKAAQKADYMREQAWSGAAMASKTELSYTAIEETMKSLDQKFSVRNK